MKKKNLYDCPVCDNELLVTRYECRKCGTVIEGVFAQDKFSRLSQDDKDFIELFVMKRGSIKEIEKEMGISYPTVRNKLDSVISALGHKVDTSNSRVEILQMLDNGEISTEDAQAMLKNISE